MDNNNNDTDASPAAARRARLSLSFRSLQIFARSVAGQLRRAGAGLIAFAWLFIGIYPAVTPTGVSWQTPQARAGSVLYVNDAAGRLAAVIDPASNAAVYKYDAVGNILSINQYPATQVSIITVNQNNNTGTQARICGTGFSTTLSQNTVSFNGVTGTILSVSGACLIVSVPSNATTGAVTLTTPSGSATSGSPYVLAPTITGFTPASGDVGATVTVSGSGLNPVPGATIVFLGATAVSPTSISGSQLIFSVPVSAGSGPVRVITPYGQATSTTDCFIAPSVIGSSNVVSHSALKLNGSAQTMNLSAPGQFGAYMIDATAGQLLSLQITSLVIGSGSGNTYVNYQVYSPGNIQIASGGVSASQTSIHLDPIPTSGTYLVVFGSGTGTAQLSATLETAIPIMANGQSISLTTTGAGQSKRLAFAATAGQNLGFSSTVGTGYSFAFINPDGSSFNSTYGCDASGCPLFNLPQAGTYTVILPTSSTSNYTATLSTDVTDILTINKQYTLNLASPGQDAVLSFTTSAVQNLAISVYDVTGGAGGVVAVFQVYKSDGTYVTGTGVTTGVNLPMLNLPAGTYFVRITTRTFTGPMMHVMVSTIPDLAVDTTVSFSAVFKNQSFFFDFTAMASQNLGLGFSGNLDNGTVWVYDANGKNVGSTSSCNQWVPGCDISLINLAYGTYSVRVQPAGTSAMNLYATLSADVTANLSTNTPYNLNLSLAGQEGLLSFTAASGQSLTLTTSGVTTLPANTGVMIAVYNSAGTLLTSVDTATATTINLPLLPAGTYTIRVIPDYAATASLKLTLVSPQDGDLNADGIVNVADVALTERMAIGLVTPTANQLLHGDVAPAGGNGVIDSADVARIRRKALGLESF